MSADDDQIRSALSTGTPSFTAHSALREFHPSMQRARMRRRLAVSATAAALLVGGGAGVFALTATRDQTTLRSVTSNQFDEPLPPVTEIVAGLFPLASATQIWRVAPSEPAQVMRRPLGDHCGLKLSAPVAEIGVRSFPSVSET